MNVMDFIGSFEIQLFYILCGEGSTIVVMHSMVYNIYVQWKIDVHRSLRLIFPDNQNFKMKKTLVVFHASIDS